MGHGIAFQVIRVRAPQPFPVRTNLLEAYRSKNVLDAGGVHGSLSSGVDSKDDPENCTNLPRSDNKFSRWLSSDKLFTDVENIASIAVWVSKGMSDFSEPGV